MTEQHGCVWELKVLPRRHFKCKHCPKILGLAEVETHLNEYETLKKAKEALSAEDALKIANGYALKQDDYNTMKAYADILEGEK